MSENLEQPGEESEQHANSDPPANQTDPQPPASESEPSSPDHSTDGDPEEEIRVGSPFAVDPNIPAANRPIEPFYDVGPIRYTAMGAVAASVMVLAFALAAVWWFPSGGALITALGCVLSIFGMYSAFRLTSVGLLAIHLLLFVVSYGRSIG